MKRQYPSQARLRELFCYNVDDGFLYRNSGKMAGNYSVNGNNLCGVYSVGIGDHDYEGGRLVWIYHHGDIPDGAFIFRKKWYLPPKIENIYLSREFKERVVRPSISESKGKFKSVWKNKDSKSWSCSDLNGKEWYFFSENAAATHYDNVCEKIHGYRPNETLAVNVASMRVTKSVAKYIQTAKKSIKDRGVVGVYISGKRFKVRFDKKNIGGFQTKEEAALAYNKAAYAKYGELAILNDLSPF